MPNGHTGSRASGRTMTGHAHRRCRLGASAQGGTETIRIGINGLGRIGRAFVRRPAELDDIKVAAVNGITDLRTLANLLEYDSTHGRFPVSVVPTYDSILVDEKPIRALSQHDTPLTGVSLVSTS